MTVWPGAICGAPDSVSASCAVGVLLDVDAGLAFGSAIVAQVGIGGAGDGDDRLVLVAGVRADRELLDLEFVFRRRLAGVGRDDDHVAGDAAGVEVGEARRGERRLIDFGEAEAGQERVAERLVIVERIGLGADPDSQVAVFHDVAQEGRIQNDVVRLNSNST